MNRQNPTLKPRSAARARIGAIAAVLGVTLAAAAPASAGDEFGRGFENEMGRIVAHATFGAGLGFLHAVAGPPVYHQPPAVVVHTRGHRPHYRHAARHHRHDRHCGHGYYDRHPYKPRHHYKHQAKHHYKKNHYRKHRRHHRDYDRYDDYDDDRRRPHRRGGRHGRDRY